MVQYHVDKSFDRESAFVSNFILEILLVSILKPLNFLQNEKFSLFIQLTSDLESFLCLDRTNDFYHHILLLSEPKLAHTNTDIVVCQCRLTDSHYLISGVRQKL